MTNFQQRPSGLIVPGGGNADQIVTPQQARQPVALVPLEQVMGLLALFEEVVIPTLMFYADGGEDKGQRATEALAQLPMQAEEDGEEASDDVPTEQGGVQIVTDGQ